jgi:hypothetical protein
MPRVGWIIGGVRYSDEEVLEKARENGHFHVYPLPFWEALIRNTTSDRGIRLSPSSAGRCARLNLLKATEPYWLDPDKAFPLLRGTAWHGLMEHGEGSEITLQLPITVPIDSGPVEVLLRGRLDYYDAATQRIIDFKSVGKWWYFDAKSGKRVQKPLPEPEHVVQVNLYRLLAEHNNMPVREALIWYFQDAERVPRTIVPVDLWTLEDAYYEASELARPIAEAIHLRRLPPCTCKYPGYGMHIDLCASVDSDAWHGIASDPVAWAGFSADSAPTQQDRQGRSCAEVEL